MMSKTYTDKQLSEMVDLFGERLTILVRLRFIDGLKTPERNILCTRCNEIGAELETLGCTIDDMDIAFDVSWDIFPIDIYLGYDKKVLKCVDIK